jgi:hypothetical protein
MRPFAILLVSLTVLAIAIDLGCDDPTIAAVPTDPVTSASFTGYGSQSVAADPVAAPATPTPARPADPSITRYIDDNGQAWELRTVCNGTVCSKEWVRAAVQAGPVRNLFNRPRGGFVRRFLGRFGGRIFRRAAFCSSC